MIRRARGSFFHAKATAGMRQQLCAHNTVHFSGGHLGGANVESIRDAIETASGYLREHPDAGAGTDTAATAVLDEGLRFRVAGPNGEVTSDMSESVGGGATAPTPAWLLRAGLASCDATLVAMEAARDGIELTDLTVTVDSDSDFRGILGVDDAIHPGPRAVRTKKPGCR